MKTIEEAIQDSWEEYIGVRSILGYRPFPDCRHEAGFEAGANHIMSLPISERLTAEEREKIKQWDALMREERDKAFTMGNIHIAQGTGLAVVMMRDIFGAEMFVEEGGGDGQD